MSSPEQPTPKTTIITLLESNALDAAEEKLTGTGGTWTNNLNEQIVLKDGDALTVKQSMIDTTTENENLIIVKPEEKDITISYGMYLTDSGNGTENGGNAQTVDFLTLSDGNASSPSGRNYILQNQSKGLTNHEIWFTGGVATNAGLAAVCARDFCGNNPGASPADDFSIQFIPRVNDTDWWDYTIAVVGGATYAPAVGATFPLPPDATSPLILKENLQGMKVKFYSEGAGLLTYFYLYAEGWEPANTTPHPDFDHIASITLLYNNVAPFASIGYESRYNRLQAADPAVPANKQWVFKTGTRSNFPPKPAPTPQPEPLEVQWWNNRDPVSSRQSYHMRLCTSFRMIVDFFPKSSGLPSGDSANQPYQTTLSYKNVNGVIEYKVINFKDWDDADRNVYNNLFLNHELHDAYPNGGSDLYKLDPLDTPAGRKAAGFPGVLIPYVQWVQFQQLVDSHNPLHRTLEPFGYDTEYGIRALPYPEVRGVWQVGRSIGIDNPRPKGVSNPQLLGGQITNIPFPQPSSDGATLTPRIYTTKISITSGSYTYDALAQAITDQLNSIPRQVVALNNNPDAVTPPADNPVGFSGSRLLTSTYELGMQQTNAAAFADRLPSFPSDYTYIQGAGHELIQPVWLDESGQYLCQFDETSLAGVSNPRWCGAEALSFIFDDTSNSFQVAQAHSNIYSRLNGGIILRQFKVDTGTSLVTADKAGGIFLTGLEPYSLFFDKMKLIEHEIIVDQFGNNPALRNFLTGSIDLALDANANLGNTLTHTLVLTPGRNITGNFRGLSSKIDKRVKVAGAAAPIDTITGGSYGAVNTAWNLDINTDTPITIGGSSVTATSDDDPYFQIEIAGINNSDMYGQQKKNNLIQSIVGKYFSNGNFTSGNSDDSFEYIHKGEPLTIKSISTRILNSDGSVAVGLGLKSAVILEVTSTK